MNSASGTTASAAGRTGGALEQTELDAITSYLAERAEIHDRDASFPADGIQRVHEAGLLTATAAARYGGAELGLADTVRILHALGRGDPAVALVSAMTLFLHARQARTGSWPDEVYRQVIDESARRPVLLNSLRVEPDLGTPTRGGLPNTVARRVGDEWALSGRKIYSTGGAALRWVAVWARTDEPDPRTGSFLVRTDSPGVRVESTWDHLGLRASRSDDVHLDDVRIPLEHVSELDVVSGGAPQPLTGAWNALGLSAIYLGVASAAQEWLTGFLHRRVPSGLGASLATLPRFQAAVGENEAQLIGSRELLTSLATRIDAGDEAAISQAATGKITGLRAAVDVVGRAVELVGNHGLTRSNPLERHYRDVLCGRVHTPQDDVIVATLGNAALDRHQRKEGSS